MPKHASKAQAKPTDLFRYRPLVECLEDRSVPGNMLLGPTGMMAPSSWMPGDSITGGQASTANLEIAKIEAEKLAYHRTVEAQAPQYGSTSTTQVSTVTNSTSTTSSGSGLGELPGGTNTQTSSLQPGDSFVGRPGSTQTFANADQAMAAHYGLSTVNSTVAQPSMGSKEWTFWLSSVNSTLAARAFGAATMELGGGGGVGGGGSGGISPGDSLITGTPTPQWLVELQPGVSSAFWANAVGAVHKRAAFTANTFVWQFPTAMPRDEVVARLNSLTNVVSFQQVIKFANAKMFAPNDSLYPFQWHLSNDGSFGGLTGADANVKGAWDSVRGRGITIGVLDDGVEHGHRDLQQNYDFNNDFDFVNGVPDGGPKEDDDTHGTSVAGVAAARGNNFIGVTGAAPEAKLAGLKILGGNGASDLAIGDALTFSNNIIDVYNNSWGPAVPYVQDARIRAQSLAAIERGALNGRNGLGSVYVFAAGNAHEEHDADSNFEMPNNSPYVITVGAISNFGTKSGYSQEGTNLLVSAPSNGGTLGIVTTDRSGDDVGDPGDYTFQFGGTSSASPLVSGVVALMLEANPNLGYRDVEEIIARTARKVDPTDSGWFNNAIGLHFNKKYGFGMINATAAVNMAKTWNNRPEDTKLTFFKNVNQQMPDFDEDGVSSSINIPFNFVISRVAVDVDVQYDQRGDLQLELESPGGTTSLLARPFFDPDPDTALHTLPFQRWTYTSAAVLGEQSQGNWTLKVADMVPGLIGNVNNWSLTVYGHFAGGGGGGGGGGVGGGDVSNDSLYEPNDTSDKAKGLGFVSTDLTIDNLGIVAKKTQDRDWFRFTPTTAGNTTVNINMQDGSGDLDARVYRKTATGLVQVGAGQHRQNGGSESITFKAAKNATYYVWIYGYQGAKGAYDLNIDVPG